MPDPVVPANVQSYFAQRWGPGGHGAHAGVGLELIAADNRTPRMRLKYRADLARSARQQCLHAGAIITGIDSAMGMSMMMFLEGTGGIATLDFRYDEFIAPPALTDVIVEARTERMEKNIAYVLGACVSEDGQIIYGRATARFIRTGDASPQFMQALQSTQSSPTATQRGDQ